MPSVQHQYVTIYAGDGLLSMAVLTVITAVRSITVPGSAAVPLATLIAEPEAQATSSPGGRANSGKALTRPPAACKRIEALLRGRGYLESLNASNRTLSCGISLAKLKRPPIARSCFYQTQRASVC